MVANVDFVPHPGNGFELELGVVTVPNAGCKMKQAERLWNWAGTGTHTTATPSWPRQDSGESGGLGRCPYAICPSGYGTSDVATLVAL